MQAQSTLTDHVQSWRVNCTHVHRGSSYTYSITLRGNSVGWNRGLGYAPYGERFKEFRRMFHHTLGPRPAQDLLPLQGQENARLLLQLLDAPDAFIEHARQ